jgi:hypothetical protein
MQRLCEAFRRSSGARRKVEMSLVYRPPRTVFASRAVAPGVQALTWQEFVAEAPR